MRPGVVLQKDFYRKKKNNNSLEFIDLINMDNIMVIRIKWKQQIYDIEIEKNATLFHLKELVEFILDVPRNRQKYLEISSNNTDEFVCFLCVFFIEFFFFFFIKFHNLI